MVKGWEGGGGGGCDAGRDPRFGTLRKNSSSRVAHHLPENHESVASIGKLAVKKNADFLRSY